MATKPFIWSWQFFAGFIGTIGLIAAAVVIISVIATPEKPRLGNHVASVSIAVDDKAWRRLYVDGKRGEELSLRVAARATQEVNTGVEPGDQRGRAGIVNECAVRPCPSPVVIPRTGKASVPHKEVGHAAIVQVR